MHRTPTGAVARAESFATPNVPIDRAHTFVKGDYATLNRSLNRSQLQVVQAGRSTSLVLLVTRCLSTKVSWSDFHSY
ncbi:MAG: hypothetical protein JWO42_4164 [Chloroflexi bacterium]|nr:hypothetical protein [Chloroflexota bacterium]